MNRPLLSIAAPHVVAGGLRHTVLCAFALLLAGTAFGAPQNNAYVSAYGAEDTQTGPADVFAGASKAGSPGSSAARASAGLGSIGGWSSFTGCQTEFPLFQQICNAANSQSSFSDVITIVSDAPFETPVVVQGTYSVNGRVDGTGAYGYGCSFDFDALHFAGPSASTGGLTAMDVSQAISGGGTQSVTVAAGHGYPVSGQLSLGAGDRACDGGSQYCDVSTYSWSMTLWMSGSLQLSVPTLPAGATYVHLIGSGGHDWGQATTAVPGVTASVEGLSTIRPNPSSGTTHVDLTLVRPLSVDVGVFDLAGRRVATLTHGALEAGQHELAWDGRDVGGAPAPAGMYLVRARGEGFESTRRVLRVR